MANLKTFRQVVGERTLTYENNVVAEAEKWLESDIIKKYSAKEFIEAFFLGKEVKDE